MSLDMLVSTTSSPCSSGNLIMLARYPISELRELTICREAIAVPARARAATRRLMSNILTIPYSARDSLTVTQDEAIHPASQDYFLYIQPKRGRQSMEPGLIAEHLAYIVCSRTYCRTAGPLQIHLEKQNPTISVRQGDMVRRSSGDLQA